MAHAQGGPLTSHWAPHFNTVLIIIAILCANLVIGVMIERLRPACKNEASAWHLPAESAGNPEQIRPGVKVDVATEGAKHSPQGTYGSTAAWNYQANARANLTAFKDTLLSPVHPVFGNKETQKLWPMFSPIITCPEDRPLTRYGGRQSGPLKGDGAKLLCKLQNTQLQQTCTIYSLGSNGELA